MKTKTRFHKLTAWLLTVAMLMTFIPSFTISVSAAESDFMFSNGTENVDIKAVFEEEPTVTNVASVTIDDVTTEYATLKEAFTAASYKTATITLLRDYDAAYETSQPYTTGSATVTTFDLGGHTLSYTNLVPGSYTSRNPAFAGTCTVQNGTIEADNKYFALSAYSSYSCAMTIKGNVIINTTNEYGNAVGVTANTTLIIESGASITSNNSDSYTGGAICVYDGGKVILNGGNVVNNGTAPAIASFNGQSGTTVVINGGTTDKIKAANVYFNVDNAATVTGTGNNAWYKLTNSIPTDKAAIAYTANTTVYEGTTYGLGGAAVTLTAASASGVTVSKILANDTEATLSEGVYSFTMPSKLVTLTAETGDPVPVVTDVKFNSESPAYDEETHTFYVSDSNPFILTITGENLTSFNETGGLKALFKREISNAGWTIIDVTIQSDTVAYLTVNTFTLTYILNDPLGSRKATAVMLKNENTQYGDTIYVDIVHAPTYKLKIKDSVGGTVSHDNLFSDYIAVDARVTLTIAPDNGYELESLTVDGTDVTEQVSGGTYTFTMPAGNVIVSATFKAITANVSISAVDVADGEEIAGALIQVIDSEGNVVDEWVSSGEAHQIEGLNTGVEYTLHTTVVPEKYTIPTDTKFAINEQGKVTSTGTVNMDGVLLVEIDKIPTYTVTFVDWDDTVLGTDTVEMGKGATAPANPTREGWKFTGWDKAFDNVTGNLTVTAQYVEKTSVTVPDITSKVYNGSAQTATVPESERYTVKANNGGTDVNEYDVVLELTDSENYKWNTTNEETVTLKFNITAATNKWITAPSISDWTYNEAASTPSYEAKFGTVKVEYKKTNEEDLAYTTTVPTNAGNYKVRFSIEATTNYSGLSKVVDVTIKQLPVNITWENAEGLVYDGTEKTITAVLSNKVTDDDVTLTVTGTTSATEKGTYTATVTAVDNDNYTITNGTNLTKNWVISETANEWTSALSIEGWTFGDEAKIPSATAKFGTTEFTYSDSFDGAYTDTVPTNAGTYYVKATVAGTASYAEISATAQFVIEAKELNADNITAIEAETYTGEEINPVLEVKDGDTLLVLGTDYEVTYQNNVNAGTAKALVTFKGNYKGTAEKEFTILKKQIDSAITLTAPVKNTAPQTEITGDGYTATVVWSPEVTDKFGYNTEYTATITITVDENHTVTGIAANGYTVEGARTVTNDENSNVLTAAYEKTGSRPSSGGGSGGVSRYTVKFETSGGTAVENKSVTRNSKLTAPTAPTKDGFTFEGWYTDKELTTAYDFDTKVTKNFTLYAKWNEAPTEDDDKPGTSGHNCPSLKFNDLDITQWYHLDTDYVIEKDIFRGTTETTFTPNGNITRAMMITVLYRAEGEPEVTGEATFEDIDENAYYAKAVVWGQQNGIIKGYSETEYAPEQDILREQIAAIMHRYAQYKGYDVTVGENTNILSYDDYDRISEYAIASMQWAVGSGMIKGRTESTLNPEAFATRVEIAAMLHRFIEANK